ncbi:MAG TPA: histidinol-phosphate transaminase [Phycisphaerae bacterium]|nr:histidinol-phosphate transaminase [Phycisphaerae bacterium]
MTYFRENIERMAGYVPGEQPAAGAKVVKLNTNENPYPPSPKALEALRAIGEDALRRYPDPLATRFRAVVAEVLGVPVDWIIAGNGSDEVLTMILQAFVGPGDAVAYPMPTYVLYRTLTEIQEGRCVEVPFDEEYRLPAEELAAARAKLTFVASPNSPSGTAYGLKELEELAGRVPGVLVVDEAYVDFADATALDLVRRRDNVLVLRTLSKGYSLAGLRLGFGAGQPSLLEGLWKVKDSYNVDAIELAVGAAAFADQAYKIANAEKVKASRAKLAGELEALGYRVWPSQSNFLLARPPAGDAGRIYLALKAEGIFVRYFQQPALEDKLRITVGTDEQNGVLVRALEQVQGLRQ